MEYEINFLVLQSHTETVDKLRDKVKSLIKEHEGTTTDELVYKKRRLAYEIKHEMYGFFTVLRFTLENNSDILDLKRELNLVQDIIRYVIVRADALPKLSQEILTMETREKSTIKQEDVEKMIAKSAQDKESKREVKQIKEEKKEERKEEIKETPKETTKKEEEKKEDKKEGKDSDDKSSLEDLDKKLDEILSI
jgi:small subunit ribosomal protein S6